MLAESVTCFHRNPRALAERFWLVSNTRSVNIPTKAGTFGGKPARAISSATQPKIEAPRLEALVLQIAAGDKQALSRLYEHTVAQVFAIARGILRSKEDAEEVVCDVYVHVWQQAADYDASRGNVMAWLIIMAKNRAIDAMRKRRASVSLDDDREQGLVATLATEGDGPDQVLAKFQSGTAVHRALASLTPLRRRLLGLAFFRGLSHQEIAEAVGMPLGTVKSHVRRALASMQAALAAEA
jgi:RNA polymerase sigma-70 factor (ECF subfamily)